MAPLSVPIEVYERAIDHLYKDQLTLRACALVCRTWLPSSRFHLFRMLIITGTRRLRTFLGEFDTPEATIVEYLRDLTIQQASWKGHAKQVQWVFDETVTGTNWGIAPWKSREVESQAALLCRFDKLTRLDLRQFTFPTMDDFKDMISNFPLLEELALRHVGWGRSREEATGKLNQSLPQTLRRLELGYCDKRGELLDWLISQPTPLQLSHLSFSSLELQGMRLIGQYLPALGPSVRHLTLFFVGIYNGTWTPELFHVPDFNENIDLSRHMPHVRSLHISRTPNLSRSRPISLEDLFALVEKIHLPALEDLRILISLNKNKNYEKDIFTLNTLFSEPQWAALRKLRLDVSEEAGQYFTASKMIPPGLSIFTGAKVLEVVKESDG